MLTKLRVRRAVLTALHCTVLRFTRSESKLLIVLGSDNRDNSTSVLLCPRFSWDIKNVLWTDRRGDQKKFADAVRRWKAFHDSLCGFNSNKIIAINQGVVLLSHWYGRAKDVYQ